MEVPGVIEAGAASPADVAELLGLLRERGIPADEETLKAYAASALRAAARSGVARTEAQVFGCWLSSAELFWELAGALARREALLKGVGLG